MAVATLYILARLGFGIPCLFYQITGLQCPGCGNTRAVLAMLRLDVKSALEYNLLFPLEFGYIGWVLLHCCRRYLQTGQFAYLPSRRWLDAVLLALVVLWWILRNLY